MRPAIAVQKDTRNILENRYKGFLEELTKAIEKACQDGKFKTIWSINTDSEGKAYLLERLKQLGYSAIACSDPRDSGFSFQIKWDEVKEW